MTPHKALILHKIHQRTSKDSYKIKQLTKSPWQHPHRPQAICKMEATDTNKAAWLWKCQLPRAADTGAQSCTEKPAGGSPTHHLRPSWSFEMCYLLGQTVPKVVSKPGLEVKFSLVKIWIPIIGLKVEGKNEVITFKSKVVVHENFASVSKCSTFSQSCSTFIYISIMFSEHLS